MSPLNQKDSRWNVLCGLRTEGLNTVEDIVRGLQRRRFCRSPIKANEPQILQNKDHQRVPGGLFPINLAGGGALHDPVLVLFIPNSFKVENLERFSSV